MKISATNFPSAFPGTLKSSEKEAVKVVVDSPRRKSRGAEEKKEGGREREREGIGQN